MNDTVKFFKKRFWIFNIFIFYKVKIKYELKIIHTSSFLPSKMYTTQIT